MSARWYYGPSKHQTFLLVFKSAQKPTESTHGHYIGYGVGPYRTAGAAIHAALRSKAHPGWPVYKKDYRGGVPGARRVRGD